MENLDVDGFGDSDEPVTKKVRIWRAAWWEQGWWVGGATLFPPYDDFLLNVGRIS